MVSKNVPTGAKFMTNGKNVPGGTKYTTNGKNVPTGAKYMYMTNGKTFLEEQSIRQPENRYYCKYDRRKK